MEVRQTLFDSEDMQIKALKQRLSKFIEPRFCHCKWTALSPNMDEFTRSHVENVFCVVLM